jgi:glutamate dehydrogenase
VSIEHQAPAVAEPDESGAALVDELLAELDAGRTGPLAEFVRAYVRRAPPPLRAELTVQELAAQVRSVFAFVNGRPPGELAVRAYNPDVDRDGWSASGSVVDVNVEDSPFLVDTVTSEIHAFSCQVRVVLHPVMGVERAEDGTIEAVTPARGAPRRE